MNRGQPDRPIGTPSRWGYLGGMVEESLESGHRFKALRYFFMTRSCGVDIGDGLTALCQELCEISDAKVLKAASDQAQAWARMVCTNPRDVSLPAHVTRAPVSIVLHVNGRRLKVQDKHQLLHEAFRPIGTRWP